MNAKNKKEQERRERSRKAMADLRAKRKEEGLCLWCGDLTVGFSFCERCRKRGNIAKMDPNRDRYRQERGGVRGYSCSICGARGHNKLTCQTRQEIAQGSVE